MNYKLNQPIYYIPSVKFKNDLTINYGGIKLFFQKGSIAPINLDTYNKENAGVSIEIMINDGIFNNIITIDLHHVDLICIALKPKYKIGDTIVKKSKHNNCIPFKIAEYTVMEGNIWYRNEWSTIT